VLGAMKPRLRACGLPQIARSARSGRDKRHEHGTERALSNGVSFRGLLGHPFIDLEPYLDLSRFDHIDEEISLGLTEVAVEYTGGSHKSMGIVPPSLAGEPYVDYGEVIAAFDRDEFARFISLADAPGDFDLDRQHEYSFGEERDVPLTKKQMR
jgi:hypothetical protein